MRQVGKTYSVLEFGRKNYDNVVYINFEDAPSASDIFIDSLEPKHIVPQLARFVKQTVATAKTLIFLDEIQLCERALTSLKYFCEFAPEYHIIAAGSLLGIAVNRAQFSYPVGKIDMNTLRPMDMEEFLIAFGEGELVEQIKAAFADNTPLPAVTHKSLLEYYRQYLLVGGMPECVAKYIDTKDFTLIRATQNAILSSYLRDMSKYNTANEIKKTHLVYDNITVQLSKKNTRFQYKLVKKGGRASEFENAIEWLVLSGIITRIHLIDQPAKPLENYRDIDTFKVYVSDVGLLCAKKQINPDDILYQTSEINDFKGGMTENYVCNQLTRNGYSCYYWQSDGIAELDFVIQREGKVIPIEVKSADNVRAKSLAVYTNKFDPAYAIKISANNFGFENGIKTIPLYAAFCI